MSESTPGPWVVRQNAIGKPNIITESWDPVIFAVCVYDDGNPCAYTAMTEADARLIAAAPDMLAALKATVEWANPRGVTYNACVAAIVKAEGPSAQT